MYLTSKNILPKKLGKILFALVNKNYQLIKVFLFILISTLYHPIYNLFNHFLNEKFYRNDIFYVSRIIFIILFLVYIFLICFNFITFYKKNAESLILLGTSNFQYILLFFITRYEFLFLQIYFGSMVFRLQGIKFFPSLCINILNAFLVYTLGILASLKCHSKEFTFLTFMFAGILGGLIGTNKLSYESIYNFMMSEEMKLIIFSNSLFSIIFKVTTTMIFLCLTVHLYKNTDITNFINGRRMRRLNLIGDCIHKLNNCPIYEKNYWGIYRNKDFLVWKIFSSAFLLLICYTAENNFSIFVTAYVILLITAFYYKDIYNFERNLLLIYFLSNYSYKKLLIDFTISGLYILGDNILLILLIRCLTRPIHLFILPLILVAILFIAFFVNSSLFVKYPRKQYNINIFLIIIKLHIPILNILFLYQNTKRGIKNWETLTYEHIQ